MPLTNQCQIKPTKTVPRSSSYDINDAHRLIQIIKARRESQTSLNKCCSSSSLDDLSEVVSDMQLNSCQINLTTNYDNSFTTDHIPDLNSWLENSTVSVPSGDHNEESSQPAVQSPSTEEQPLDNQVNCSRTSLTSRSETVKFLNLSGEQLTGKQLQILTSLSYLVNEERLSIMICKLKLPFFKNLYQQLPLHRKSNLNTSYMRIYQQLELIKRTKFIYVKTYLIDSTTRKRISKKKSSLLSVDGNNCILNNNPYDQNKYLIINELMIFKIPKNELSKITIRLTVLGLSSLSHLKEQLNQNQSGMRNKKIKRSLDTLYSFGYVEIGYNSLSKSAFLHYQNLLNDMRRPTCMWHSLDLSKQTKRRSSISS